MSPSARAWRWLTRWRGVILATVAVVATLWLAATGKLILYIHPRYVVFTVIMAAIALVITIASVLVKRDHEHDEPQSRWQKVVSGTAIAITLVIAAAMIVIPPATLTSATASQRDVNSAAVGVDDTTVEEADAAGSSQFASFTVRDWASLLRQTTDLAFYADKAVDVTGFISEDPSDPDNIFFVSRFVVTCCAVDAQPVGVPVYLENWKSQFSADDWVKTTGVFGVNPSSTSDESIALVPSTVEKVSTPDDPYLF